MAKRLYGITADQGKRIGRALDDFEHRTPEAKGETTDPARRGFRVRFGVAQSVTNNEVTLTPCKSWDDPTPIPGAADVVCFITWPPNSNGSIIHYIGPDVIYAYLPIPRGGGTSTNRGALLPVPIAAGCNL